MDDSPAVYISKYPESPTGLSAYLPSFNILRGAAHPSHAPLAATRLNRRLSIIPRIFGSQDHLYARCPRRRASNRPLHHRTLRLARPAVARRVYQQRNLEVKGFAEAGRLRGPEATHYAPPLPLSLSPLPHPPSVHLTHRSVSPISKSFLFCCWPIAGGLIGSQRRVASSVGHGKSVQALRWRIRGVVHLSTTRVRPMGSSRLVCGGRMPDVGREMSQDIQAVCLYFYRCCCTFFFLAPRL